MATYYSDNATRLNEGRRGFPGFAGSMKVSILETYEAAALASGSTVNMFKPPKGYRYAGTGQLAWDDMAAATATIAVGLGVTGAGGAAVPAAFLAATDVQAAADKADLDAGAAAVDYLGYEFDGETWVTLTSAGGNAQTGTLKLLMDFLLPA
jgi:hypothetical protein